jgi:hypothetical protein
MLSKSWVSFVHKVGTETMFWVIVMGILFAINAYFNPRLWCALPVIGAIAIWVGVPESLGTGAYLVAGLEVLGGLALAGLSCALHRRLRTAR